MEIDDQKMTLMKIAAKMGGDVMENYKTLLGTVTAGKSVSITVTRPVASKGEVAAIMAAKEQRNKIKNRVRVQKIRAGYGGYSMPAETIRPMAMKVLEEMTYRDNIGAEIVMKDICKSIDVKYPGEVSRYLQNEGYVERSGPRVASVWHVLKNSDGTDYKRQRYVSVGNPDQFNAAMKA